MGQSTYFSFTTLDGTNTAGYTSINNCLNSIDTNLNGSNRLLPSSGGTSGYTIVWNGSAWAAAQIGTAGIADGAITSNKILDGTIVNADINASAAIASSKLADTPTNLNTASKIVLRDASGNFSAGTITANLTGTASTATNIAGGSGGSVPYQSSAGTTAMLANGTAGQVLTSNGTTLAPSWQAASIGTSNIADNSVTAAKFGTIPTCRVKSPYATTIANNTNTVIEWTAEDFDPTNMHNNSTLNHQIVITIPGIYLVTALVDFAAASNGNRTLTAYKYVTATSSSTIIGYDYMASNSGAQWLQINTVSNFAVNDIVYFWVYQFQSPGASLSVGASSATHATVTFLGPAS